MLILEFPGFVIVFTNTYTENKTRIYGSIVTHRSLAEPYVRTHYLNFSILAEY